MGVVDRWGGVGRGGGGGCGSDAAVTVSIRVVVFVVLGCGGPETLAWDGWFAFIKRCRGGGGDGSCDGGLRCWWGGVGEG